MMSWLVGTKINSVHFARTATAYGYFTLSEASIIFTVHRLCMLLYVE